MAALGPRDLDLGWFMFMQRFFQDIAELLHLTTARDEPLLIEVQTLTSVAVHI